MRCGLKVIGHGVSLGGVVVTVAIVGSLSALVFASTSCLSTFSDYSTTMADLNNQVSVQQVKLDEADAAEPVGTDEAADLVKSATEAGERVAELQNAYIGGADAATTAQALSPFFDSDSQNDRTPWFAYATDDGAGHAVKWSFGSVCGIDSTAASAFDVVWVCRYEGTDTVLAYATGVYDCDEGAFSSVDVHTTDAGADVIDASSLQNDSEGAGGAAGASSQTGSTAIDELVEKLRNVDLSSDGTEGE